MSYAGMHRSSKKYPARILLKILKDEHSMMPHGEESS
jgi:hypothetical protein